ncbi:class I SAM-dependent methyltransferase [Roseomonas sp. SSH11]|uniref:Class I SAM-dependent methyltransferase n=1 Tax=Pararoseomonas baculiformis TaxID=2820812 RepID=A0ABS4AG73_9PROT|nr:class I SAM-dependent methyltransferase [Pararoseomonas baculiformis]MBP0445998.1 class I SAM-dependent methyltransferase [Pararoseomonas baculiformis]
MTESFDADWLELREPVDARARNFALAEALSAALPARPRLLDLGAGTGSLFRWLAPILNRPQAWTLVDADVTLIEFAFDTIAMRAASVGFEVSAPNKRTLLVHTPSGAWRVEGLVLDLADAPSGLPLSRADGVVCTALCDLVSRGWVARMASGLRLPFYSALNVEGDARFLPPHPVDGIVARGFRRDQIREKGFGGPALGPGATRAMAAAFRAQGFQVATAPSPWRIGPAETRMLSELSGGHAQAAMRQAPRSAAMIAAWSALRAAQAQRGRLRAVVGHSDLLALPPRHGH